MVKDNAGPHYRYKNIEFWANNGMVSIVDVEAAEKGKTGREAERLLRPGEFLKQALGAYMSVHDRYPSEFREARNMLEQAKEVVKLAKHQGDALDPAVIDHYIKHEQPARIFIPGEMRPNYKVLPGRPRDQFFGNEPVRVVDEPKKPQLIL